MKSYILSSEILTCAGLGTDRIIGATAAKSPLFKKQYDSITAPITLESMQSCAPTRHRKFHKLDKTCQLALMTCSSLGAESLPGDSAVVFGSSRGLTNNLEQAFTRHQAKQRILPSTSPTTTASNLPTTLSQYFGLDGQTTYISAACASGIAAVQIACLLANSNKRPVLTGTSEASVTPFTLNILKAAGVYSESTNRYPAKPMHPQRDGLVLGEAAAAFVVSSDPSRAIACIRGFGSCTEKTSFTGIDSAGTGLESAIRRCINHSGAVLEDIGLIVCHASGTQKGDQAELAAYQRLFAKSMPPIVCHKWLIGHCLGSASSLSIALAIEHLKRGLIEPHPYYSEDNLLGQEQEVDRTKLALITSMAFGGINQVMLLSIR